MERKSGLPVLDQGWNPRCCMVIRFLKDFFFPLVYLYSSNYLQHTVAVTACLSWPYFCPFIWLSCASVANIELHSLSPSPFPCQPLRTGTAGSTRLFCGSLNGSGHEELSRRPVLRQWASKIAPTPSPESWCTWGEQGLPGAFETIFSLLTEVFIFSWFFQPWVFLGWLQLLINCSCAEMLLNKHIIFQHSISLFASYLLLCLATSASHAIAFELVTGFEMHLTALALLVEKLCSSYMLRLRMRKGLSVSFLQKNQAPAWPHCFRYAGKQLLYIVQLLEVCLLLYHSQHYEIQWLNTQKSGLVSSNLMEIIAFILIPLCEDKHF